MQFLSWSKIRAVFYKMWLKGCFTSCCGTAAAPTASSGQRMRWRRQLGRSECSGMDGRRRWQAFPNRANFRPHMSVNLWKTFLRRFTPLPPHPLLSQCKRVFPSMCTGGVSVFVRTGKRSNNGRRPARSFAKFSCVAISYCLWDYCSSFPFCQVSSKVQQLAARSVNRMQLVPAKAWPSDLVPGPENLFPSCTARESKLGQLVWRQVWFWFSKNQSVSLLSEGLISEQFFFWRGRYSSVHCCPASPVFFSTVSHRRVCVFPTNCTNVYIHWQQVWVSSHNQAACFQL